MIILMRRRTDPGPLLREPGTRLDSMGVAGTATRETMANKVSFKAHQEFFGDPQLESTYGSPMQHIERERAEEGMKTMLPLFECPDCQ